MVQFMFDKSGLKTRSLGLDTLGKLFWKIVMGPRFKISSERLGSPGLINELIEDNRYKNVPDAHVMIYSQTCVKRPYRTRHILAFQTGGCLLLPESSTES